jgi:hypothetical protein
MKQCPSCGDSDLPDRSNYCLYCGVKLEDEPYAGGGNDAEVETSVHSAHSGGGGDHNDGSSPRGYTQVAPIVEPEREPAPSPKLVNRGGITQNPAFAAAAAAAARQRAPFGGVPNGAMLRSTGGDG